MNADGASKYITTQNKNKTNRLDFLYHSYTSLTRNLVKPLDFKALY